MVKEFLTSFAFNGVLPPMAGIFFGCFLRTGDVGWLLVSTILFGICLCRLHHLYKKMKKDQEDIDEGM